MHCDRNIFSTMYPTHSYWQPTDTAQLKKIGIPAFFAKIWDSPEESMRLLSKHIRPSEHNFFVLKTTNNLASEISDKTHELSGKKVPQIIPLPAPAAHRDKQENSRLLPIAKVVLGVITVALIAFSIKNNQGIPTKLQLTQSKLLPPTICNKRFCSPSFPQDPSKMFEKSPLNETITPKEAVQEAIFPLISLEGEVYEGDFINDEMTGKGKYTWPDGTVEEGDFINGMKI